MKIPLHKEQTSYLKNFTWLIFDQAITNLLFLAGILLIARYLGPEDFGILTYSITIYGVFGILTTFGLRNIVPRNITKDPDNLEKYLGTAFFLKLAGSILAFCLLFIFSQNLVDEPRKSLVILIYSVQFFIEPIAFIDYYLVSQVKSKYTVIARFITVSIFLIIKIILINFEVSLEIFALAAIGEALFLGILKFSFFSRIINKFFIPKFDFKIATMLLKDSWIIGLNITLATINTKTDIIMIEKFLTNKYVGLYQYSLEIINSIVLLITLLINSLIPYFVQIKNNNEKLYERRYLQLLSIGTYTSIFLIILLSATSEYTLPNIYGINSNILLMVFDLHLISVFVAIHWQLMSVKLINENKQKYILYLSSIGFIINLALNYILIIKYNIIGAAIATVVSSIIVTFGVSILFTQTKKLSIRSFESFKPHILLNAFRTLQRSIS